MSRGQKQGRWQRKEKRAGQNCWIADHSCILLSVLYVVYSNVSQNSRVIGLILTEFHCSSRIVSMLHPSLKTMTTCVALFSNRIELLDNRDLHLTNTSLNMIAWILFSFSIIPVSSFLPFGANNVHYPSFSLRNDTPTKKAMRTTVTTNGAIRGSTARRAFYSSAEDSGDRAEPLPLTADDMKLLTEMKSRHTTIPILILDALLPGQKLCFKSDDPKFHKLVEYCLNVDDGSGKFQLGMLGMNPYTGKPLCRGVTLSVTDETIHVDAETKVVTMLATGQKRMEVQGEPWLDETKSFYLADIEIVDNRREPMTMEQLEEAEKLSQTLPARIEEWVGWVLKKEATDEAGMNARISDLGPMPTDLTGRALWTAALVNPLPSLGVCLEIRPAMLSCSNDLERMILACQAVQSSIDHLSGKHRLF